MVGKLGHGDTNRVYKPKIIDFFAGLYVRKVACGSQSSLALVSTGQVSSHITKYIGVTFTMEYQCGLYVRILGGFYDNIGVTKLLALQNICVNCSTECWCELCDRILV